LKIQSFLKQSSESLKLLQDVWSVEDAGFLSKWHLQPVRVGTEPLRRGLEDESRIEELEAWKRYKIGQMVSSIFFNLGALDSLHFAGFQRPYS
jgi:hypothetical protein